MDPSENDVLQDLLARCYDAIHAGRAPDLDAICAAHPSLRARVARLLDQELELARGVQRAGTDVDTLEPQRGLLEPGSSLGDFRIIAPLGAGGMGDVYVAVQEPLGRRVALKVLACRSSIDRVAALRFRREAEITAALNHPNIVPVFASGDEGGVHYLAMKLLEGPSLDRAGRLEFRAVAQIGATVARALEAAHRIGVVHRDVKPANIVIEAGTPFVLDFGLARSGANATLTREDAAPGTLPYMAPEQLRGTTHIDQRTDVYGLGATLYEALSGAPPFAPDPPASAVRRILTVDPPRLRGVDRDLAVIVERAMDKDPARRFQTAAAMADDLERYLAGEPIVSRPSGVLHKGWKLARRNPIAAASAAMLLVASVTTVGLFLDARWDRARRWQLETARLRQEVAAGEMHRAIARLAELREESHDPAAFAALAAEVGDHASLRYLVVELNGRVSDPNHASDRYDLARRLHARTGLRDRADMYYALAYTAALVDKADEARSFLDRLRGARAMPRTVAALSAHLDGRDVVQAALGAARDPNAPAVESARDHLCTASVFALAGLPLAAQEPEMLAADHLAPDLGDVRFRLAVLSAARGDHRQAYEIYRAVEAVDPHRGLVSALLADMAIFNAGAIPIRLADPALRASARAEWLGRARDHVARAMQFGEGGPEAEPSALVLVGLRLAAAKGEYEAFWERWRRSDRFASLAAYWDVAADACLNEGRDADALPYLRRALDLAVGAEELLNRRAYLLGIEARALRISDVDGGANEVASADLHAGLRELLARVDGLVEEARRAGAREAEWRALGVASSLHAAVGERSESFHAADRACYLRDDPATTLKFVAPIGAAISYSTEIDPLGPAVDPTVVRHLESAWHRIGRALETGFRDDLLRRLALVQQVWLAYERGEIAIMVRSARATGDDVPMRPFAKQFFAACTAHGLPPFELVLRGAPSEPAVRARALAMLRVALAHHRTALTTRELDVQQATAAMRAWLGATALVPVRDPDALAALPTPERDRWSSLWDEVRTLANDG